MIQTILSGFRPAALLAALAVFPTAAWAQEAGRAAEPKNSPAETSLFLAGDRDKLPEGVEEPPHVVLISGDEEYRSEEALPMLAQILAGQHGFDCTVLFSINPETQSVDPNYTRNTPGLEALKDADAMVLFTRFRQWPAEQMEHFEAYLRRGDPIVALRTATHPFNFPKGSEYESWSYNSTDWPGGFGQQIIGETWVSHHGKHKVESARAVVEEANADHPILRGVDDVWAPSDVYGVTHLPESATILLRGQVLSGMNPDDPPVTDGRNDPMMPLAWTKTYRYEGGEEGKVFCSTMASAVDLKNEGLRRLIVNAVYWAVGLEEKIPAQAAVRIPGDYQPSFFGFHNEPGYFSSQNKKPRDYLVK